MQTYRPTSSATLHKAVVQHWFLPNTRNKLAGLYPWLFESKLFESKLFESKLFESKPNIAIMQFIGEGLQCIYKNLPCQDTTTKSSYAGADIASIPLVDVLFTWDSRIIRFLDRRANPVAGAPFAAAFVAKVQTFLESKQGHPEHAAALQDQADRTFRHFCHEGKD